MLSRRIVTGRSLRAAASITQRTPLIHQRWASKVAPEYPSLTDAEDPDMNGGYINPPAAKRQFRDPYADWWDKQERRNYGEPVNEDNDILGMFSLYEYTWVKPGKGALQLGAFVVAVLGLCGVVSITYPDTPTVPREFEGGLELELGGPDALRARAAGDP